jgi:Arc/MetJ family transcription regulator
MSTHRHVWHNVSMATNLALDDKLLAEAQRIGGKATKKATVTEALEEYINRRKQARVTELFGTVAYDPRYDYKKQRRRP